MLQIRELLMAMSFGEVVRYHRTRLGLTQEALAERMGRSYTRISKVEQGHTFRRLPDADEFRAWAEALETPPEVFLSQMGFISTNVPSGERHPEMVFASLADEIRSAKMISAPVKETALDGIKAARRLYDAERGAGS